MNYGVAGSALRSMLFPGTPRDVIFAASLALCAV